MLADFVVIALPPGNFTLTSRLEITRPKLVLRGSGKWDTTLYMPKSLTDLYGPNPDTGTGGYIYSGAFIEVSGDYANVRNPVATVTAPAWRGEHALVVSGHVHCGVRVLLLRAWLADHPAAAAAHGHVVACLRAQTNHPMPTTHASQVDSVAGLSINQTVLFTMTDDKDGSLAREL